MICYAHALKRHGVQPAYKNLRQVAEWKELQVGTHEFWMNIAPGKLAAFQQGMGVYVGFVEEYDFDIENGYMWIYFQPDPTHDKLPEGQDTLPVSFAVRDKIMMEVV